MRTLWLSGCLALKASALLALSVTGCRQRTFGNTSPTSTTPEARGDACRTVESCLAKLDADLDARRASCATPVTAFDPYVDLQTFARAPNDNSVSNFPFLDIVPEHPKLRTPNASANIALVFKEQYAMLRNLSFMASARKNDLDALLVRPFGPFLPSSLQYKRVLRNILEAGDEKNLGDMAWGAALSLYSNSLSNSGSPQLGLFLWGGRHVLNDPSFAFRNAFETGTSSAPGVKGSLDTSANGYLAQREFAEAQIIRGEAGASTFTDPVGERSFEIRDVRLSSTERPKYLTLGISDDAHLGPVYGIYGSWVWGFGLTSDLVKRVTLTNDDSLSLPSTCSRLPYRLWKSQETALGIVAQLARNLRHKRRDPAFVPQDKINLLANMYPRTRSFFGVNRKQIVEPGDAWMDSLLDHLKQPTSGDASKEAALFHEFIRVSLQDNYHVATQGYYLEAQVWGGLGLQDAKTLILPKGEKLTAEEKSILTRFPRIRVYMRGDTPEAPLTPYQL